MGKAITDLVDFMLNFQAEMRTSRASRSKMKKWMTLFGLETEPT